MPVTLFIAPPASGKTGHAVQRILQAASTAKPGSTWAILASEPLVAQFHQRLGQRGGVFGVQVSTFSSFYRFLLEKAGRPVPVISSSIGFRLIRQAVAQASQEGRLRYYDPIKEKPGFINLLAERFAELKRALVFPMEFIQGTVDESPAIREMAYLYQVYQEKLSQIGWADSEGLSWLAVEALQDQPAIVENLRLVLIDGFTDFNGAQLRTLVLLARSVEEVWISLPGEIDNHKIVNQRFARSLSDIRQAFQQNHSFPITWSIEAQPLTPHLPDSLGFLAENLFEPAASIPPPGKQLVMLEAASPEEESREALRWLKAMIVRQKLRPQECAVFFPNPELYVIPLQKAAREFGLPIHLTIPKILSQTPEAAAIQLLFQLLLANFPRRPLLDCLRSPYFDFTPLGLQSTDSARLENVSSKFRILEGVSRWQDILEDLSQQEQYQDSNEQVEDESVIAPEIPYGQEAARLQKALALLFERLSAPARLTLSGWVSWLENLLAETSFFNLCGQSERGAIQEAFSAMAVSEALTAPAEMNCLEFLDELLGTFDSTPVDPLTGRLEKSIFIGRFLEARGLRFKAAAILGLSEGIFPEIERADPFLSETLRDRFHLERRLGRYQASLFYQIVTRADETLMLCRPYLAEGGETWIASHTWQNIHRLFSQEASPYPVIRIRAESLREVTQAASCAEALFYAARRGLNPAHDPDLEREAARLDTLRPVLAARLAEKAEGPYEGHPAQLAGLTGEFNQPGFTWSATHLETYGSCPFRYFVQHSLHLVPKLPPEPGLDAAQLGSLYHAILERAYQFASDPAEPDSVIHSLREQAAKIFELAPQYFTFIPDPLWEQQQAEILSRLEKTVQALADISQGWQPMAYEQSFGYGASPALELATGTGKIRLRGFIDRLDRDNQGRTRLIDYKTGSSGMEAKDLLEGRRLQLPLYALAASQALGFGEVVDGFYWSIHETKPHLRLAKFEEGALSGAEGATTVALDYVDRYVSNIHSAFFPPRPPAAGCPEYCPASLWCWRYSPSAW